MKKINKTTARKLFNEGKTFFMAACNMRVDSAYQRTGKAFVPVDAIVKQYNSYIEPTHEEGFDDVFFGEVTRDVEEK